MKQIMSGMLIFSIMSIAFLCAVELEGFSQNPIMKEQTLSFLWGTDVNVHINAPAKDSLKIDKETMIVFYALPAGNTIEWTIGKKMMPGDDWHYDIQHIGAQTRFLRKTLKEKNFITVYVQPTSNSWALYSGSHPNDYLSLIHTMTDDIISMFSSFNYKVTLNGHSAGGGWVLRNLLGRDEVPPWVERLGFLDSNYNYKYDADHYDSLFCKFLLDRDSTYLCLLAYNDSIALYGGAPIVSAEGGTWWNARYMKKRLDPIFDFADSHDVAFRRHIALDRRFEILLKENPTREILHTVQVYRNGFIHSMLSGTEYENSGYTYYGEPAYLEYIQGNPPARPEGAGIFPAGKNSVRVEILPVADAIGYRTYLSTDGINFCDTLHVAENGRAVFSGLENDTLYYATITAINRWGESPPLELLPVTAGSDTNVFLIVNGNNRTPLHSYLKRHADAAHANGQAIASCSNYYLSGTALTLSDFYIVDYALGTEDRKDITLDANEQAKIKEYLKQGGNLFISGMNIAYDLDIKGNAETKTFCNDYLKMTGVSNMPNGKSNTYYEAGFRGFDFFDTTMNFLFDNGTMGSYNVSKPDGIRPHGGAYRTVIFTGYDPAISCAGVSFTGTFPEGSVPGRIFTMTIPFETIIGDSVRNDFMSELIRYFNECGVAVRPSSLPRTNEIAKPYPNPFNPEVTLPLMLKEYARVELTILDLRGRVVEHIISEPQNAGRHEIVWDGRHNPAGIYFCVLKVDGDFVGTQKLLLLK